MASACQLSRQKVSNGQTPSDGEPSRRAPGLRCDVPRNAYATGRAARRRQISPSTARTRFFGHVLERLCLAPARTCAGQRRFGAKKAGHLFLDGAVECRSLHATRRFFAWRGKGGRGARAAMHAWLASAVRYRLGGHHRREVAEEDLRGFVQTAERGAPSREGGRRATVVTSLALTHPPKRRKRHGE